MALLSFWHTSRGQLKVPKYIRIPFLLSILLSSTITLMVLAMYFRLQPQVPIFYSLANPSEYLADKQWIMLFPLLSFSTLFIHIFVLSSLKLYEKIINQMFVWTTVVIQSLFFLAVVRILIIIS